MENKIESAQESIVRLLSPDEFNQREISKKVRELADIKRKLDELGIQKRELEGYFLKLAEKDLGNTKLKTVSYAGPDGDQIVATMAESLKLIYPTYLKQVFGETYKDVVTEEVTYKLTDAAKRMLTGLWKKEFIRMTVQEVISQIALDANAKKALLKKVRGANYAGDKKNLMAICGFDEKTAEENAYFIAEAAVWQSFLRLLKVQEVPEGDENRYLDWIDGAVVVEENPKLTICCGTDSGEVES